MNFFRKLIQHISSHGYSSRHIAELNNLNEGLMRKVTPPEVAADLIKHGHAVMKVGGLVLTEAGYHTMVNAKTRIKS